MKLKEIEREFNRISVLEGNNKKDVKLCTETLHEREIFFE